VPRRRPFGRGRTARPDRPEGRHAWGPGALAPARSTNAFRRSPRPGAASAAGSRRLPEPIPRRPRDAAVRRCEGSTPGARGELRVALKKGAELVQERGRDHVDEHTAALWMDADRQALREVLNDVIAPAYSGHARQLHCLDPRLRRQVSPPSRRWSGLSTIASRIIKRWMAWPSVSGRRKRLSGPPTAPYSALRRRW
jgi:hypothetical protein